MSIGSKNFFEIFSLPESFDLDLEKLSSEYKRLQSQSHPDKFSDADDATRLQALQLSSYINEAFVTLKAPLTRAAYLLKLQNIDPEEHNQAHLSEALLMQQMDWRDLLEFAIETEDMDALERLKQEVKTEHQACIDEFRSGVAAGKYNEAKPVYNKLQFIEKMLIEINRAEEKILDY